MILLNFAHPLTRAQRTRIEELGGGALERVVDVPAELAHQAPFGPQVAALADRCALSPAQWQTLPLLINPPSLNFIALVLLAEVSGRCGYLPTVVRVRPVPGSIPRRFEVAELVDLQAGESLLCFCRTNTV